MKYLKPLLLVALCLGCFVYGMASLKYKIFPYYQIIEAKIFLTHTQNQYQETEKINTFLERLLVKKVHLNEDIFRGGAIENIGPYLFLVTNKGKPVVYDLENYERMEGKVQSIPMNFEELMNSEEKLRDDFRPDWFRVSGIYAEQLDGNTFRIFATHHYYRNNSGCVDHNISRMDLSISNGKAETKSPWHTIFSAEPCIQLDAEHYSNRRPYVGQLGGGKIMEYNDSTLLVTVGEYDRNGLNNTENYSQDPNVPYGKTILVNKITGKWSIFTSGHRNILGIYGSRDGTIWVSENGPQGGDELNILEEGANYGWPEVSYGIWYLEQYVIGEKENRGRHTNYRKPVYSWVPSIAPNNLVRIEGDKFDHWKGDLLIGTMRDQSLQRIRLTEDNQAVYTERINLGHRVRDLILLEDKSIAIITDDGFLIILDDGGSVFEEIDAETRKRMEEMNRYDGFSGGDAQNTGSQNRMETASMIFNHNCGNCHSTKSENFIGPHLNNLFEREVGSVEDFTYSTTLMQEERTWSRPLLRSFLLEPETEFPNNNMQQVNLTPSEVDSIISYLKKF